MTMNDRDQFEILRAAKNLNEINNYIRMGYDINVPDDQGKTVLMLSETSARKMKELIIAGINVEIEDERGWRAIHHHAAVEYEKACPDKVEILIESKANLNAQTSKVDGSYTPLMLTNHGAITYLLLKADADTNIRNTEGATALMLARTPEQIEIILKKNPACINHIDIYGANALLFHRKSLASISLLIKAGANVNQATTKETMTPFMYCSNPRIMKAFIEAGADLSIRENNGNNALLSSHSAEVTEVILETGFDVNTRDFYGVNALMKAINTRQMKALLKAGAEVNNQDNHGRTALMYIYMRDKLEAAEMHKLLLSMGASDRYADEDGMTVLDYMNKLAYNKDLYKMPKPKEEKPIKQTQSATSISMNPPTVKPTVKNNIPPKIREREEQQPKLTSSIKSKTDLLKNGIPTSGKTNSTTPKYLAYIDFCSHIGGLIVEKLSALNITDAIKETEDLVKDRLGDIYLIDILKATGEVNKEGLPLYRSAIMTRVNPNNNPNQLIWYPRESMDEADQGYTTWHSQGDGFHEFLNNIDTLIRFKV